MGCGTGALCAAILDRCSPPSVAGVEPSEGLLETAKGNLAGRVALHQGNATAILLGDASVDVVVSGLVLNFVPDQPAALLEMARVTRKGGPRQSRGVGDAQPSAPAGAPHAARRRAGALACPSSAPRRPGGPAADTILSRTSIEADAQLGREASRISRL